MDKKAIFGLDAKIMCAEVIKSLMNKVENIKIQETLI